MDECIAPPLVILLIDSDPARAKIVEDGLAGRAIIKQGSSVHGGNLMALIHEWQPDAIIMDCDSPDRDTIENLRTVAREHPKPIVMFVDDDDGGMAKEAVRAGVSAYIVDGLAPSRVLPVIEIAIERFRMVDALHKELQKSKEDLASRKVVERAKGILMEQRGMAEGDAYNAIRNVAMKEGKTMRQVSENILSVASLLQTPKP